MSTSKCWANIDKSEGSLDSTLNIYFDKNKTGENRSVKIAVKDEDGNILDTFTLVQKPSEVITYKSAAKSKDFVKEGCNEPEEKGETVTYSVPYGKYTSTVSQTDADSQADADIAANGQAYANANGKCITALWYNTEQKGKYRKNDCDADTERGSEVILTVPARTYTSTISQADADNQAINYIMANGQAYANENGTCQKVKWYSSEISKDFQRTDCLATEVGTYITYTVEEGKYTYTASEGEVLTDAEGQAKADALALADLNENGPLYANENAECKSNLWYNEELSATFQKEDCGVCKEGAPYEYTVEAGKYVYAAKEDEVLTPEEGQAKANALAQAEIDANGQAAANTNGECQDKESCFIGKVTTEIQRNDCAEHHTGSMVTITEVDLPGYPESYVADTEEAANALAEAALETYKEELQAIANERGVCTENGKYTGSYSAVFTKSCEAGGEGGVSSEITVSSSELTSHADYPFEAYTKEEADALAKAAVEEMGSQIAEEKCTCTWTGEASMDFTKECEEGFNGTKVTVTQNDVTGGPFTSTVDKASADALAEVAVSEQGQAIANEKGECVQGGYAGYYEQLFYKNNCESCTEDLVGMTVTSDMTSGYPFYAASEEEANNLAKEAVLAEGQAIANKNISTCTPKDSTPVWVDIEPEASKCIDCVSYKQQIDTNECSESYNSTDHWVEGGSATCEYTGTAAPRSVQKNDCAAGVSAGTTVEVTVEDLASIEGSGYPFVLCGEDKQPEANALAEAALDTYAQEIANTKGSCMTGGYYEERFYVTTCGSCQEDTEGYVVTSDMVGGPFYGDGDLEQAQADAEAAVKENGQAYVNKNFAGELCKPMSTDAVWVDVEPAEYECQNGVSMKKQVNTNECYGGWGTDDNYRWVEGGSLTCQWVASDSITRTMTRSCADSGVGASVTLTKEDMAAYASEYNNWISFDSQDAANALLESAFDKYGETVAQTKTGYTCTWTATYTVSLKPQCATCYEYTGSAVTVTAAMVNGGTPVTSTVSLADANTQAKTLLNSSAQSYVNKNVACTAMSTTAVWTDTGSTQCNGCTSQKQQKDTNSCSSTYNQTKWVNGGNRTCTDWYASSETYCSGHSEYYVGYDNCSSDYDNTYEWICDNCCDCGSVSYSENGCSGEKVLYSGYDSCGNYGSYTEYVVGKCGYCGSYSATGSYECSNGTSYAVLRDGCGNTKLGSAGGTACTATNTTRYCKSGCTCEGTCVEVGEVSASGATTSAAQSAANSAAQSKANNGSCGTVYSNTAQTATKTGCASGCVAPTATVSAGSYTSCTSQSDANSQAKAAAQSAANAKACDCPAACDNATIVYGVESATGNAMVSYWGSIYNNTTGYSVYANVNDEVSTTVGSETVEAGVTYSFSADDDGSFRCNTSEAATGTSSGLGLSSITPDCGETVYVYVVVNDTCQ